MTAISKTAIEPAKFLWSTKFLMIALVACIGFFASPAFAQGDPVVANAKRDGVAGEMADGYIGFRVGNVSAEVRSAVNKVNIKRRAAYSNLAKKGGVTVQVASVLTAEKLMARAKPGEYVRLANGKWQQVQ